MKRIEISGPQFRLETDHLACTGVVHANVDPLGSRAQKNEALRKMVGARDPGQAASPYPRSASDSSYRSIRVRFPVCGQSGVRFIVP